MVIKEIEIFIMPTEVTKWEVEVWGQRLSGCMNKTGKNVLSIILVNVVITHKTIVCGANFVEKK